MYIFSILFRNSKPVDVPDAVEQRFRQVLDDLKMDEVDKTLSRTFMSIRPDLHHIGLSGSNYSFRIGLPLNFAYNSPEDINPNMKVSVNCLILYFRCKIKFNSKVLGIKMYKYILNIIYYLHISNCLKIIPLFFK